MAEMETPETQDTSESVAGPSFAERGPLIIAIVATVLGLCIVCVTAYFLLRDSADLPGGGGPLSGVLGGDDVTPTPFPVVDRDLVVRADIDDSAGISVTLSSPVTLIVGGQAFTVQGVDVDPTGRWTPELTDENVAAWAYGTIINYVLGLDSTSENRRVMEGLAEGDEIRIVMQNGAEYVFVVISREIVPSEQADIFRQQSPGVTLVLVGSEGGDRLIVRGNFQGTEGNVPAGSVSASDEAVEMGDTVELADLRLSVLGTTSLFNRPEIPAGFMFFLVDFQIQNTGTAPFATGTLNLVLRDEFGNQYALNPVASQLGNSPPLIGFLNPGDTRNATAGYQIPVGLTSPTLVWVVGFTDGSPGQIRVRIPFTAGIEDAAQNALVVPQSAEVSLDGTSVTVVGQITNVGSQTLVVNDADVTLTSEGTLYLKLSTNPTFPWAIPPGQTITYSVAFQRPLVAQAVFTVLNQPFLLTGLR
jgi:hypothetical protein